jgi:hypothetical protein
MSPSELAMAMQVLDLVNQERADAGLAPLAWDDGAAQVAYEHSVDMDLRDFFAHTNPDGMELVSNWYMRTKDPKMRSTSGLPRLYQKYVGHDNNRDSYMSNQPETEAFNRQMFIEWFPQIMYNQHQTGPAGTVLFAPPFRDPFNYNYDPLVPMGIEFVAQAINRCHVEGKAGAVSERTSYSVVQWRVRTATGFYNRDQDPTEIISSRRRCRSFMPQPPAARYQQADAHRPQEWHRSSRSTT